MSKEFTKEHQSAFPFINASFVDDVLYVIEETECPLSYKEICEEVQIDNEALELTLQVFPEIAKALESVELAKVFRGVGGGLGLPDMENSVGAERKQSPKVIEKQISPALISIFKGAIESLLAQNKKGVSVQAIANKVCLSCPSTTNPSSVRVKQLEMLLDRNEFEGIVCAEGIVSRQKKQLTASK